MNWSNEWSIEWIYQLNQMNWSTESNELIDWIIHAIMHWTDQMKCTSNIGLMINFNNSKLSPINPILNLVVQTLFYLNYI